MGEKKGDQQTKYLVGEKGMRKRKRVYRGETKSGKQWGGTDIRHHVEPRLRKRGPGTFQIATNLEQVLKMKGRRASKTNFS